MTDQYYRSRKNRVLGGVAGGLAEYWNLDPVVARVLFIIVAMMSGIGFFLYIVLWIIIPEETISYQNFGKENSYTKKEEDKFESANSEEPKSEGSNFEYKFNYENNKPQKGNGRIVGGIILIGFGLFFLAERIFPYFDFHDLFPLIFIGVGLILIFTSNRNRKNAI